MPRDAPAFASAGDSVPNAIARRTPATPRFWSGSGGSARTTRRCRARSSRTATCATGAGRPVSPGRGWCRGRAARWTTSGAPAGSAARCRAGTWSRWPDAGCGTGRTARYRSGSRATSTPATGGRAGAGSWRWLGSFRWPCGGSPRPGWCPKAPSCRGHGRGRPEHPNTRAARRGLRETRVRVTVKGFGSPRTAAPFARMGPTPRNVAPPEQGTMVTGPAARTGQEPGRAVGRSPESDVQPGESPVAPKRP